MGSFGIWHWVVVGIIALFLFGGRGKISELMGDAAKGIKAFKKGMQDDDTVAEKKPEPLKTIDANNAAPVRDAQHSDVSKAV